MNSENPNNLKLVDSPTMPNGRILVVDDERNIRSTLQMVLRGAGFRVEVAANGEEAEAHLAKGPVDVVLLDVRLPGRSGLELLAQWRSQWPEMMIVLMSGEASLSEALEGLKQGAFDFLEKPILSARLLTSLGHGMDRVLARRRIDLGHGETVVGSSPAIKKVLDDAGKIAHTKARVLISGESGTGKDLLARYLHLLSARKDRPFVKINCASIPADLIESELFGHVKGAFTGATSARRGHFEVAHGGTLFLDEVGELPLAAQAKMLRTLQNGEITPVGTSDTSTVDVRVIAATNRDLKSEVQKGTFREDLYYRLAVVTIESPPLRSRIDDIQALVHYFICSIADEYGMPAKQIDPRALVALNAYSWPGNIRELRNVIERCMILCGTVIGLVDLPPEIASCAGGLSSERTGPQTLAVVPRGSHSEIEPWHEFKARSEREHVLRAIEAAAGNMTEAARILQVERQTIYKWIKSYGIERSH